MRLRWYFFAFYNFPIISFCFRKNNLRKLRREINENKIEFLKLIARAIWTELDILDRIGHFGQNWTFRQNWTFWTEFDSLDIIRHSEQNWKFWTELDIMDIIGHYGQNLTFWTESVILKIIEHPGQNWTFWTETDILDIIGLFKDN